jgi:hypothetical protein
MKLRLIIFLNLAPGFFAFGRIAATPPTRRRQQIDAPQTDMVEKQAERFI